MGKNVFVSYPSDAKGPAQEIALALAGQMNVFFDRNDLPPGTDYHARIRSAIQECDVMVFVISPASVTKGSYALSELKFAEKKWRHPKNYVLPVRVGAVNVVDIPVYLRSVTILDPTGNLAAEVAAEVEDMVGRHAGGNSRATMLLVGGLLGALGVGGFIASGWHVIETSPAPTPTPPSAPIPPKPNPPTPPESVPAPSKTCTIRTRMIFQLLAEPDPFAANLEIGRGTQTLQVSKTIIYDHVVQKIPMYEVRLNGRTGWLSNDNVEWVSPDCR